MYNVPSNVQAEQYLIGAILYNNERFESISEYFKAEHFCDQNHQSIWAAITLLISRGQAADPITLKIVFASYPNSSELSNYVLEITVSALFIIDVEHYSRMIYDLYLRRQLILIGTETVNAAKKVEEEHTTEDQITLAEQKLFQLATQQESKTSSIPFSTGLAESINMAKKAFQSDRKIVGITSGLIAIDESLGGFHKSDLIILAGRPSMGKTALATNIAYNAAKAYLEKRVEGGRVLFFSLEMSAEQLCTRILATESKVPSSKIRKGEVNTRDFENFIEISRTIESIPLHIDDTGSLSISALRSRARRAKSHLNIDMIIIDYLQLITGVRTKGDNRVNEISDITRQLKGLAKELNIPIIALSQLSRSVEQRDDKRPQLSDLRESGSIEQDADVVLFVYREEYYASRKEPSSNSSPQIIQQWQTQMNEILNKAEVLISKHRHGSIGIIKLGFDGRLTRFYDL